MLRSSAMVILIRVEPCGIVQPITHNQVLRKNMAAPIPRGMAAIPLSMVQPIAAVVLERFAMTNKDGALHQHAGSHFCKL